MGVKMNSKTKSWLVNQGNVITISPNFMTRPIKNKQLLFDFECVPAEPEDKNNYYLLEEDGIRLYVHRKIEVKNKDIKLWLRGNLSLEQLEVRGLKRMVTVK